jgi:Tfp pilus assembly protein PilV
MRDECAKLERELTETERLRFGADADRRQLRCELTAAKEECDLNRTRLASIFWSGAMDKFTGGDVQKWAADYTAELTRLRAEVEQLNLELEANKLKGGGCQCSDDEACAHVRRAEKAEAELAEAKVERETVAQSSLRSLKAYIDKLKQFAERAERAEADNAKWQKLLLMSRDDREIDLISEIEEQARLLGMSGEREADLSGKLGRLESELAAIKHGHGELGKYEQLRLKNAELQRDKARLDWLESPAGFDWQWNSAHSVLVRRAAIDAAMKGTP